MTARNVSNLLASASDQMPEDTRPVPSSSSSTNAWPTGHLVWAHTRSRAVRSASSTDRASFEAAAMARTSSSSAVRLPSCAAVRRRDAVSQAVASPRHTATGITTAVDARPVPRSPAMARIGRTYARAASGASFSEAHRAWPIPTQANTTTKNTPYV